MLSVYILFRGTPYFACSKISSGGSLFIEKLVPEGTNFFFFWGGGVHFNHDRTLLASNPGLPSGFCLAADFSPKQRDKIWNGKPGFEARTLPYKCQENS